MNDSLVALWTNDDLSCKISFILEKLWYQNDLKVWDIPWNIQTFLISRLALAPQGVIGYIWTEELKNQIIWLLDICILLKKSLLKVNDTLELSI